MQLVIFINNKNIVKNPTSPVNYPLLWVYLNKWLGFFKLPRNDIQFLVDIVFADSFAV
jgi:hypothetical protein